MNFNPIYLLLFALLSVFGMAQNSNDDIEIIYDEEFYNEDADDEFYEEEEFEVVPPQSSSQRYEQEEYETEVRKYPAKLSEKYKGEDFDYTEEIAEKKPKKNIPNTDFSFLNGIGKLLLYIFIGIGAFAIVYFIYLLVLRLKDPQKLPETVKKPKSIKTEEQEVEEIQVHDFLKLSVKSENEGNYRLAYRYLFLEILQTLNTKSYIFWKKDKTNTDYIQEIKKEEVRIAYQKTATLFNYIWYGKFILNHEQYAPLKSELESLKKSIQ